MSGKSELKINSKFAEKYDKYRQREELQRLKDRYGDQDEGESSDSDSDEDSEVELDPKLDKDFYRTLSLLKKRDPKIYQTDATFYTEPEAASGGEVLPSTSAAAVKVKPMFLKDYERKVILERGGKYDDEEEEDEESDEEEAARRRERAASPSYMQEQRELKESFRQFVHDSDDDDDDDDEEEEKKDQLLTKRTKTQKEKDQEEEDYVEWLKGQAELDGPEEVQDMKFLRDYWNDPELDEKERFLRDFVLNKKYLEEQDHGIPTYDEVVQDDVEDSEEEGESFLLRQEDFERQYNFRFEEPDAQKIKTYPRTIATSVRSKDERRKTKREEVKERKIKEKQQKQAGLKQLKNLKRGQILDKLQRLRELTGNQEPAFREDDLDGDFNPQQHDQLMQKLFGEDYYGNEEEEKPQFDDEEMEEHWNWDTWTGDRPEDEPTEDTPEDDPAGEGGEDGAGGQPDCDDPDFIMDADYDPSQPSGSKRKRRKEKKRMTKDDAQLTGKRRKRSHFAEVITKDKPVFDPQEKSFEQYLDEYYGLDYEDIIDDLPCRFRYRPVLANDFGLTTDEILGADEKDLNRWCSLKKTCMFRSDREEQCDLKNFQIKARNEAKKKEILSSFYSEEGQKKKRERQKKGGEEEAGPSRDASAPAPAPAPDPALAPPAPGRSQPGPPEEEEEFLVPKKKEEEEKEEKSSPAVEETTDVAKKKMKKKNNNNKLPRRKLRHPGGRLISRPFRVKMGGREFSGQRLKAYGLDPKRLHFRQLGRQKRKAQEKRDKQKGKEAA